MEERVAAAERALESERTELLRVEESLEGRKRTLESMKADFAEQRAAITARRGEIQESGASMARESEGARRELATLRRECSDLVRAERDQGERWVESKTTNHNHIANIFSLARAGSGGPRYTELVYKITYRARSSGTAPQRRFHYLQETTRISCQSPHRPLPCSRCFLPHRHPQSSAETEACSSSRS